MTTAPSLFSSPAPLRPEAPLAAAPARSLVDLLYDGFYLLTLMRRHSLPADAEAFSGAVQGLLDDFERAAVKAGFGSQDIFDAKYAFCAAVDEAVLGARTPIRDAWERRPLQLVLFGEQLAGEHFFDRLEAARNDGARRLQALEVFHMCLLTGFKGRYLLEGPEKLKYLVAQLGEQITHLKGKPAGFAPHWAPPDQIVNAIRREIPLWIIAAVLTLVGLLAYLGLEWHARSQVSETLASFTGIVQLAPRPPTLTLTLP